jgi:hypothetical protein
MELSMYYDAAALQRPDGMRDWVTHYHFPCCFR